MGNGCSSEYSKGGTALPPELPHLKIALVGDPGVGKTSILLRYLRNQFSSLYIPTKKVAIENVVRKLNVPANTVVSLTFWDIPGREDMDVHTSYFRNLDAAIVVVDMSNPVTMEMANVWKQTVLNKLTKTVIEKDTTNKKVDVMVTREVPVEPIGFPVLLLGNKFELIEEEMYLELANRTTSVSMDVTDIDLRHDSITQLHNTADKHSFIGSMMVSARQTDNSVSMAIQALVRNILEKKEIPRKWKPAPEKVKRPKPRPVFQYEKLHKVDIEKILHNYNYVKLEVTGNKRYDEVIEKADAVVKEVFVLRHYFTVSLARLKDTCNKSGLITEADDSLEACIIGMKRGIAPGSVLQIVRDEYFFKLDIEYSDESEKDKVKQSRDWKLAYKCFHNEFAAIATTIVKDGPNLEDALMKYDLVMDKILNQTQKEKEELTNQQVEEEKNLVTLSNQIIRNRARIQHAQNEIQEAMSEVEDAGNKIVNVNHW